jgi:P27 family predicted phage terminase small subunit
MARPRTPTKLKLVKGTAQPCRTNSGEPKLPKGIPPPPEHLSDRARRHWPGIAKMLLGMGVLTKADGLALYGLCETYGELVEARQKLAERGALSYRTEKEHPLDAIDDLIEEAHESAPAPTTAEGAGTRQDEPGGVTESGEPQPHGGWLRRRNARPKVKVMWRMYPEVAMINELDRRFAMWLAKVF